MWSTQPKLWNITVDLSPAEKEQIGTMRKQASEWLKEISRHIPGEVAMRDYRGHSMVGGVMPTASQQMTDWLRPIAEAQDVQGMLLALGLLKSSAAANLQGSDNEKKFYGLYANIIDTLLNRFQGTEKNYTLTPLAAARRA